MEIEGLTQKAFEFTIKWVVDANAVLEEGTVDYIEHLQQIGSAEVVDIKLVDKEN